MRLTVVASFVLVGALEMGAPLADGLVVAGAKAHSVIAPERGFVGSSFAFDRAGGQLTWVHVDDAHNAAAMLYDVAQRTSTQRVPMKGDSAETTIAPALDGQNFWVVSSGERGKTARVIAAHGRTLRTFGPAADVVQTLHQGAPVAVTHRTKALGSATRHFVEVRSLATGRRVGKVASMTTDKTNLERELDFRVHQWADNHLSVVGTKGGAWDPEENQRTPDLSAGFLLLERRFTDRRPISDPIEYRRASLAREEHPNQPVFVYIAEGNQPMRVTPEGRESITLAEDVSHYDIRTLSSRQLANGGVVFSMRIDPVHPEAAARKLAVKPWTDVYYLAPGETSAVRKARFRHTGKRALSWQAARDTLAILEHHVGFDHGGARLHLFDLR